MKNKKIVIDYLTSNPPMKGAIVSGDSGDTAPNSFQFFVRPWLIEFACSAVVKLKTTANEFPSCGTKVVVALSVYIPRASDQRRELNAVFNAVAFTAHAFESSVSFRYEARSALPVKTYNAVINVLGFKVIQHPTL